MTLQLRLRQSAPVPLEVEGVLPETVRGKPLAEIERLPILLGNRETPLSEWFHVAGDADAGPIEWSGGLAGVHWIGAKMTSGEMRIEGDAGRHIGSEMTGGEIHVSGSAGDWVGGEMKGGAIHVRGRAGHLIGAAYRGSRRGMTGGTILIGGDAGNEIGHTMRRGLIAIGGNFGDLAGFNMLAGTLLFCGEGGIRHGASMRRGTLIFLGPPPPLLPTFRRACRSRPAFMRLLALELARRDFNAAAPLGEIDFDLYHGDMLEGGRGEILVAAKNSG